jgi:uncharacterized protein YdaU (DUF1376 family)
MPEISEGHELITPRGPAGARFANPANKKGFMTSSLPYMQFFPADYLADTSHLSTVEHGAYLLLIMNYWQRGESLKAKDENALDCRLAQIARLSLEQWLEVKETIAEFFETGPTEWRHGRIERDLGKVKEKSLSNQANGKKGAETRWNKKNSQAIARLWPGHSETIAIPDSRTDEEEEKKESPPPPVRGGGGGDSKKEEKKDPPLLPPSEGGGDSAKEGRKDPPPGGGGDGGREVQRSPTPPRRQDYGKPPPSYEEREEMKKRLHEFTAKLATEKRMP